MYSEAKLSNARTSKAPSGSLRGSDLYAEVWSTRITILYKFTHEEFGCTKSFLTG